MGWCTAQCKKKKKKKGIKTFWLSGDCLVQYFCDAFYQPARFATRLAGPKITLLFPRLYICISVYLCVRTYHVRDNYITYVVAMRPLVDLGN